MISDLYRAIRMGENEHVNYVIMPVVEIGKTKTLIWPQSRDVAANLASKYKRHSCARRFAGARGRAKLKDNFSIWLWINVG